MFVPPSHKQAPCWGNLDLKSTWLIILYPDLIEGNLVALCIVAYMNTVQYKCIFFLSLSLTIKPANMQSSKTEINGLL